jgi:hypothetical protein
VALSAGTVPPPPPPSAGPLLVYPTAPAGINIRATADVDAMRITGAACGEPLTVIEPDLAAARQKIGAQDQWLYVQKSTGERGWAAAWFVGSQPV